MTPAGGFAGPAVHTPPGGISTSTSPVAPEPRASQEPPAFAVLAPPSAAPVNAAAATPVIEEAPKPAPIAAVTERERPTIEDGLAHRALAVDSDAIPVGPPATRQAFVNGLIAGLIAGAALGAVLMKLFG